MIEVPPPPSACRRPGVGYRSWDVVCAGDPASQDLPPARRAYFRDWRAFSASDATAETARPYTGEHRTAPSAAPQAPRRTLRRSGQQRDAPAGARPRGRPVRLDPRRVLHAQRACRSTAQARQYVCGPPLRCGLLRNASAAYQRREPGHHFPGCGSSHLADAIPTRHPRLHFTRPFLLDDFPRGE